MKRNAQRRRSDISSRVALISYGGSEVSLSCLRKSGFGKTTTLRAILIRGCG
jgi:hypothetical protein